MNKPKQTQMYYWLLVVPMALGLAAIPTACAPEPVAVKQAQTASALMVQKQRAAEAALMVQKQRAADTAVMKLEAVYGRMSDEERMRGVVYE